MTYRLVVSFHLLPLLSSGDSSDPCSPSRGQTARIRPRMRPHPPPTKRENTISTGELHKAGSPEVRLHYHPAYVILDNKNPTLLG